MDHTGDFTDFQRHGTDARQLIFCGHIGQGFDHMGDYAEFMHEIAKDWFPPAASLPALPCRLLFWRKPGKF